MGSRIFVRRMESICMYVWSSCKWGWIEAFARPWGCLDGRQDLSCMHHFGFWGSHSKQHLGAKHESRVHSTSLHPSRLEMLKMTARTTHQLFIDVFFLVCVCDWAWYNLIEELFSVGRSTCLTECIWSDNPSGALSRHGLRYLLCGVAWSAFAGCPRWGLDQVKGVEF